MSATLESRRPRRSRTYWARMVAEQAGSELSAEAFCAQRKLSLRTFTRWKRKLEGSVPAPTSAFVELPVITPTPSPSVWEFELELPDGVRLRLRRG